MTNAPLDFYFDFSSPYGYFAAQKIDALAAAHGRTVRWHPMLLGVDLQADRRRAAHRVAVEGRILEARLRAQRALPRHCRFPAAAAFPDSVAGAVAHRADGAARMTRRRGCAVAKALYRALLRRRASTSAQPDVAADVAGAAPDCDAAAARAAVDDPVYKDALRREVEAALAAGVFGSPFVIVDGEPFWGLDRFDQVERWLATGGF